jgi:hypothetical protein
MTTHGYRSMMLVLALMSALFLALSSAPVLAAIEPLADGLRRCSLETDEGKRLACFDALASALPKIQSDQFGMTADIARKRDPVAVTRSENESLSGKIAALQEAPRGEYLRWITARSGFRRSCAPTFVSRWETRCRSSTAR